MADVDLELVVIGSGGSGTAWAARTLTDAGLPCGHESVFDWHPSSNRWTRLDYPARTPSPYEPARGTVLRAESSLAAIAYLAQLHGVLVVHLARDPLAAAASWAAKAILDDAESPYGRFCRAHVPRLAGEPTPLGRAARWVAEWNLRGAGACDALGLDYLAVRLEDVADPAAAVNTGAHRRLPDMDDLRGAATADTVELLAEWAWSARYRL